MELIVDAMSAMAPTKAAEAADAPEDRVDGDSFVEVEEEKDDKMRRIAKTLEAGDVVEEAHVRLSSYGWGELTSRTSFGSSVLMLAVSCRSLIDGTS